MREHLSLSLIPTSRRCLPASRPYPWPDLDVTKAPEFTVSQWLFVVGDGLLNPSLTIITLDLLRTQNLHGVLGIFSKKRQLVTALGMRAQYAGWKYMHLRPSLPIYSI